MVKTKNNVSLSFSEVIDFIRDIEKVKTDKAVAKVLGITPSDFSNRKKRKAIPYLQIIEWAADNNVSLDTLFTDRDQQDGKAVASDSPFVRHHSPADKRPPDPMVVVPLSMAWSVLESQTTTAQALRLNIEEFYDKVHGAPPGRAHGVDIGGNAGAKAELKSPVGGKGRRKAS